MTMTLLVKSRVVTMIRKVMVFATARFTLNRAGKLVLASAAAAPFSAPAATPAVAPAATRVASPLAWRTADVNSDGSLRRSPGT
jgi:hypothetical protein